MGGENGDLAAALDNALRECKTQLEPQRFAAVCSIVWRNYRGKRVSKFLHNGTASSPKQYVATIIHYHEEWNGYLYQIQIVRDDVAWAPLFDKLQKWSYSILRRAGLPPRLSYERASACATDAVGELLQAEFPYDVSFDPWAYVVLRFVCHRYLSRHFSPTDLADMYLIPIDKWEGWLANIEDPDACNELRRIDLVHDLLHEVEQLPEAQKGVIGLRYFECKSYDEIALIMDRSKNALYQLHHYALQNLRKNSSEALHMYR